jgi:hypothetical protein
MSHKQYEFIEVPKYLEQCSFYSFIITVIHIRKFFLLNSNCFHFTDRASHLKLFDYKLIVLSIMYFINKP